MINFLYLFLYLIIVFICFCVLMAHGKKTFNKRHPNLNWETYRLGEGIMDFIFAVAWPLTMLAILGFTLLKAGFEFLDSKIDFKFITGIGEIFIGWWEERFSK